MNLSSLNHRRIRHIHDLSNYTSVAPRQYFQVNSEIETKLSRNLAEIALSQSCYQVKAFFDPRFQ
jgi:hypothetical protein